MKCRKFIAYETGRMTAAAFAEHRRSCAECAAAAALDARLDSETTRLRDPATDGRALWRRIEAALEAEKAGRAAARVPRGVRGSRGRLAGTLGLLRGRGLLIPVGAAAFLIVAAAAVLIMRASAAPSGILAARALARVEASESEYLAAIGDLEKLAGPRIADMDLQMASLYRDKLAAIDAQIDRCREALASNPANAHIRRYLLAALQDKRQTLADVLRSETAETKDRRNS